MAADPVNVSVGTSVALTGAVAVGSTTILGIPAEAVIASLVGAGLALNAGAKLELTAEAIRQALGIFVTSLCCGLWWGGMAASILDAFVLRWLGVDLPDAGLHTGTCFLMSMGAQRVGPFVVDAARGWLQRWAGSPGGPPPAP